ncbi:MAG: dephospho-CoA kinase [bacterium]
MNKNLIVGLTGGFATGKTTVTKIFQSLGAVIIDADKIAREVVAPNSPVWQNLKEYFGAKILNKDLTLNRTRLADLAFNNETYLRKLNEITHPPIIQKIKEEIERIQNTTPNKIIIINAPLLIEANMVSLVNKIIVVTASEATQIKRGMKRDNLEMDGAKKRIFAQLPLSEKVRLADFVIDTDCPKKRVVEKVKMVWEELNALSGKMGTHTII